MALDRVDPETIHVRVVARRALLNLTLPLVLQMIQTIGNSTANSVLEASVPSKAKRAEASSSRAEREKWIKAKYADKSYTKPYKGASIVQDFITQVKSEEIIPVFTLLQQGADVNCVDGGEYKKTALHHAAYNGDVAMLELLLLNGANANAVDETQHGWTALHYCAVGNHSTPAALLFRRGAKLDAKDKKGRTPLDVAIEAKHADCVTLLRLALHAEEERKQGNFDERSFASALSAFSVDISKSGTRRSKRPPIPSVVLGKPL